MRAHGGGRVRGLLKVGRTGAPNGRVGVGHAHWTRMSRLGRSVFLFITALPIYLLIYMSNVLRAFELSHYHYFIIYF
jgi:hypothetical protein